LKLPDADNVKGGALAADQCARKTNVLSRNSSRQGSNALLFYLSKEQVRQNVKALSKRDA
jgi:hypothetical protein